MVNVIDNQIARQAQFDDKDGMIQSVKGQFGLQIESNRFSVVGDEAFAPNNKIEQTAVFAC